MHQIPNIFLGQNTKELKRPKKNITPLVAHFDASATSPFSDTDPIDRWAQEGNALSQSVVAKQPLFKTGIQNSLPGMLFDGVDDYLDLEKGHQLLQKAPAFTPISIVIVARPTLTGDVDQTMLALEREDITAPYIPYLVKSTTDGIFAVIRDKDLNSDFLGIASVIVADQTHIMSMRYPGSGVNGTKLYVDNVEVKADTIDTTGIINVHTLRLGAAGSAISPFNFFKGYIFEFYVYIRLLTTTELSDLTITLATKWGVTLP